MLSSHLQDSFRVVTASQDLSLRVLTWRKDGDRGWTLESRYHLLGGSHRMSRYSMHHDGRASSLFTVSHFLILSLYAPCSRGLTHVTCDYSSIVASAEGNDGKDVLKAYSFTS